MATLAQLVVKLVADVSEFSKSMDSASKKLTTLGTDITKVGTNLTTHVTLPLAALGGVAVKAASDLDETKNKSLVVFGEMGQGIVDWAEKASSSYGMSQQGALDYASTYGSLLKNMGLTQDETASMSKSLVQLTADYASFHNLSPDEAFEKIKAGLVGSSEPLLSLGKDLRVTAVDAYALANSIGDAEGNMTSAQLAIARYGALMSQSGDEIGDFQRTSDGLANSSRTLTAVIEDASASVGDTLIPTAIEFMRQMIPILQGINSMSPAMKSNIVAILAVVAALGPLLTIIGNLIKIGGTVAKLFGAKGGIAVAWTWLSTVAWPALSGVFAAIGAALAAVTLPVWLLIGAIAALVAAIIFFGKDAWATIQTIGQLIPAVFILIGMKISEFTTNAKIKLFDLIRDVKAKVAEFKTVFEESIIKTTAILYGKISQFKELGKNIVQGFINGVKENAQSLIDAIVNPVVTAWNNAKNFLGIHSPSTKAYWLMKNYMLGAENGANDYSDRPQQAIASAFSSPIPSFAGAGAGAGGSVVIEYKPVLSMGSKEELIEALVPIIREVLRKQ